MSGRVRHELARVARETYGRLVAFLSARSCDVAAAEDALAEAFEAALRTWPESGAPDNPEAWLLTTARRRLIDGARHERVRGAAQTQLLAAAAEAQLALDADGRLPDERLRLMFACAHPAVDQAARAPLMLQTVLGLDASAIASAFVTPAATMGQRLSRAKARIREARVPFQVPDAQDLALHLNEVLDAIYVAYGRGWTERSTTGEATARDLSGEALELGTLLARALPEQAEVHGLMALMLHCQARHAARRGDDDTYVPLSAQDPQRWDRRLIALAEGHLREAANLGSVGRFQLEAAIQSAHAQRAFERDVDWPAIAALYEGLVRIAPTVGALVGRAAAVAEARGNAEAWELFRELPQARFEDYQPYWALRAHLLEASCDWLGAAEAWARATDMSVDPAEKKYLLQRLSACRNASS